MTAGVVTVAIDLPGDERSRISIARALGRFIDHARTAGAQVVLSPTPDDVDREIAQVRADLAALDVGKDRKAPLEQQIGRIEALNHFRRLVE